MEDHPISSIWLCSFNVLHTGGIEMIGRGRVMEMEDTNSEYYL